MYIGNIVTTKNIDVNNRFNVVNSIELIDKTKPTLIVGWDIVRSNYGENVDFIDRKLADNIFWTFNKSEHRDHQQHDLFVFKEYCYNKFVENINYIFIDPLVLTYDEHKAILDRISLNIDNNITYNVGEMVYLYDGKTTIYGFNLIFYKYMGDKTNKALNYIKHISKEIIDTTIIDDYQDFVTMYKCPHKYIPYIYSINKIG